MNLKVKAAFKNILDDKKSGSTELLYRLNNFFLANFKSFPDFPSLIIESRKHLSHFEIINEYLNQLQKVSSNPDKIFNFLKLYSTLSANIVDDIFIKSLPFHKNKRSILTISNSKTVFEILKRLSTKQKLIITICESRPRNEGRILARELSKSGVKTNLITEAQCSEYIRKCDCVLVGADVILKNGSVINKVGSLALAIIAQYYKKPFYAVADKSKLSDQNSFTQKEESHNEIWNSKYAEVTIKNFYFEKIPAELITKIITN